jgi:Transposase, Mutator family
MSRSTSITAVCRASMLRRVADLLRPKWPKLAAFIGESETDVLFYLDFPEQHRSKSHTNPLERLNKEVKRRADVAGIFLNEVAIFRLICAVLLEQKRRMAAAAPLHTDRSDGRAGRYRKCRRASADPVRGPANCDPLRRRTAWMLNARARCSCQVPRPHSGGPRSAA